MGDWVRIVGWRVVSALKSQRDLTLENLALRHQLMVLQWQSGRLRLKGGRPRIDPRVQKLIRDMWNSNPTGACVGMDLSLLGWVFRHP